MFNEGDEANKLYFILDGSVGLITRKNYNQIEYENEEHDRYVENYLKNLKKNLSEIDYEANKDYEIDN